MDITTVCPKTIWASKNDKLDQAWQLIYELRNDKNDETAVLIC